MQLYMRMHFETLFWYFFRNELFFYFVCFYYLTIANGFLVLFSVQVSVNYKRNVRVDLKLHFWFLHNQVFILSILQLAVPFATENRL